PRLLEGFLETLRQGIAACLLRLHRLLKHRLTPRGLLRQDAMGVVKLRLVAAFGFLVADDAAEVEVDDQRRLTAGTRDFDFRLQSCHQLFPFSSSLFSWHRRGRRGRYGENPSSDQRAAPGRSP